jgi:hypothetical protein
MVCRRQATRAANRPLGQIGALDVKLVNSAAASSFVLGSHCSLPLIADAVIVTVVPWGPLVFSTVALS